MDIVFVASWAIIFVLAIIIEAQGADLTAIWFMPGALVSMILSICGVDFWIQCVVFVVSSVILLIFAKTWLKKKIAKMSKQEKTDTDLLIGKTVKVVEDINNLEEHGAVKVNGQVWGARMDSDDVTAFCDEFVVVKEIKGVKLICSKE